MKKVLIIFWIILFISVHHYSNASELECNPIEDIIDSLYIYRYENNDFVLRTKQIFKYDEEGILTSTYFIDLPGGDTISKQFFSYNSDGLLSRYHHRLVKEFGWVNSRLVTYYYNEQFMLMKENYFTWDIGIGNWNNYQVNEYSYNSIDLPIEIVRLMTSDKMEFYPYSRYDLVYDSNNNLIVRNEVRLSDMEVIWKETREYSQNLLSERIRKVFQFEPSISANILMNQRKDVYQYNYFNHVDDVFVYKWDRETWILTTKVKYFRPYDWVRKFPICHNGHTIWISKNAVPAHLKHGDCAGECPEERKPYKSRERETYPSAYQKSLTLDDGRSRYRGLGFQIYPNPVKEQLTLNLGINEQNFHTVEILDLSGRVIQKVLFTGESELIINRGDLKKGLYFIRLIGDEVVTKKIVFE